MILASRSNYARLNYISLLFQDFLYLDLFLRRRFFNFWFFCNFWLSLNGGFLTGHFHWFDVDFVLNNLVAFAFYRSAFALGFFLFDGFELHHFLGFLLFALRILTFFTISTFKMALARARLIIVAAAGFDSF